MPTRLERTGLTVAATVIAFLLLLGLFWLTADKSWIPWWLQLMVLIGLPGLVWYYVPETHARHVAFAATQDFVDSQLKPFCAAGASENSQTCTPALWIDRFGEGSGENASVTIASCFDLPETVQADYFSAPDENGGEPCLEACRQPLTLKGRSSTSVSDSSTATTSEPGALPSDVKPGVFGGINLLNGLTYVLLHKNPSGAQRGLLGLCEGVAASWRTPAGPSQADWNACTQSVADDNVRLQRNGEFLLSNSGAGVGWGASAVIALFVWWLTKLRRRPGRDNARGNV